jgi:hypothetical protein
MKRGFLNDLLTKVAAAESATTTPSSDSDRACQDMLGKLSKISRHRDATRFDRYALLMNCSEVFADNSWPASWCENNTERVIQIQFCVAAAAAAGRILASKDAVECVRILDAFTATRPEGIRTKIISNVVLTIRGLTEEHLLCIARTLAKMN